MRFAAQQFSKFGQQLWIESGSQRGAARDTRRTVSTRAENSVASGAVGPVSHLDRWDAQVIDGIGVPNVATANQSDLFFEC